MVDLQSSLVFNEHEIVSSYEHLYSSFMFISLEVLFLSFSLFFSYSFWGFRARGSRMNTKKGFIPEYRSSKKNNQLPT
jgi:hypothetical protein